MNELEDTLPQTFLLDVLIVKNSEMVRILCHIIICTILHGTKDAVPHIALVAPEPKRGSIKTDHHSNYLGWVGARGCKQG